MEAAIGVERHAANGPAPPSLASLCLQWHRPFFCQVEAVETAIWLSEVAPGIEAGKRFVKYLEAANNDANPELLRLALKLATYTHTRPETLRLQVITALQQWPESLRLAKEQVTRENRCLS